MPPSVTEHHAETVLGLGLDHNTINSAATAFIGLRITSFISSGVSSNMIEMQGKARYIIKTMFLFLFKELTSYGGTPLSHPLSPHNHLVQTNTSLSACCFGCQGSFGKSPCTVHIRDVTRNL